MVFCGPGGLTSQCGLLHMTRPVRVRGVPSVSVLGARGPSSRVESIELSEADIQLSQWSEKLLHGTLSARPVAVTATEFDDNKRYDAEDPSASSFMLGPLRGTVPAWLQRMSEALPSSRSLSRSLSSCASNELAGVITVRGQMENQARCSDVLRIALTDGLTEVLAPLGTPLDCSPTTRPVWASSSSSSSGLGGHRRILVVENRGCFRQEAKAVDAETEVEFHFQVMIEDPNDLPVARELLELEAEVGGARRLLPRLAERLEDAGRISLRLEIEPRLDRSVTR